ncbi:hypothetical protein I3760_09G145700 [Carya illinoinensis]|uniref:CASP-like protein n=1 Tax=Carya illinoinensis TaxID=32201 RepID=A0A8T1PD47_CARIL|nr:CASP-like protein 1B1 [Carya illinoinensis]KAG2689577.1 hypothetical protein I3760_09G145700 [Carya illinoinensis]KAG6642566.1 hypothetical protein CIPAW_09G149300 [Carya illinoinensis]KAG6696441.1 hypothetical protein I3842_09G149000 [Carya illinoinensis]
MATQGGGKSEVGVNSSPALKPKDWVLLSLRLVAFFATATATIVMALNKQTNTVVVATVGNTPVKVAVTAKFQQTPAFVFFVVANAMASFHNWMMIVVEFYGHKIDYKGLRLAIIAILDMMTVALASAGDGAATFMADLGKNGNSHARWNKICDKFHAYCDRGSGALIASFIGLLILLIINVMSISKLLKPKHTAYIGVP